MTNNCNHMYGPEWLSVDKRSVYPFSNINRSCIKCTTYQPTLYTAKVVLDQPIWADHLNHTLYNYNMYDMPDMTEHYMFKNTITGEFRYSLALDTKVDEEFIKKFKLNERNRKSHTGDYIIDSNGYPLNPLGKTGITGRGVLGAWGPNHAADPVVARYKRTKSGNIAKKNKKPIIQVVLIKRKDNGQWAIPGGMVDPTHSVSETLMKEFLEEAMGTIENTNKKKVAKMINMVNDFFSKPTFEIFKGVVHDWRNTDNAWMETVAMLFFDSTGTRVGKFPLTAGDDAGEVAWVDITDDMDLFASHNNFIQKAKEYIYQEF